MLWAYCIVIGSPKSLPPAIHAIYETMQSMSVCTNNLCGREWPTMVVWRIGKETGWVKSKHKREEGRRKDREGGRWRGNDARMVAYSEHDAAPYPPWGSRLSSRGTLQCGRNLPTHEWLVFHEANVAQYPARWWGLRCIPLNKPPEGDTHGPHTTACYSQRLLVKNQLQHLNLPAGFRLWPRLHHNVCRSHDKDSTLASQQKNNRHPSLCEHIHLYYHPARHSASRGCIGPWCILHNRLFERSC